MTGPRTSVLLPHPFSFQFFFTQLRRVPKQRHAVLCKWFIYKLTLSNQSEIMGNLNIRVRVDWCAWLTIHLLNQLALTSSSDRKWTGSRAFSEPWADTPCSGRRERRASVLSIISSMYLQDRRKTKKKKSHHKRKLERSMSERNVCVSRASADFSGWRIQNVPTSFWKSFIKRIWVNKRTKKED